MNFYKFMMSCYKNENSNRGDLADDMVRNKDEFPRNIKHKSEEYDAIIKHLTNRNACRECLETFKSCWEEYLECEKK